jgi:hypothetical protein
MEDWNLFIRFREWQQRRLTKSTKMWIEERERGGIDYVNSGSDNK